MGATVEYRDPRELKAADVNPRRHPETQIAALAASIKEFGFNSPVLVDADGVVRAGHGRIEAALRLGLQAIPCIRLDHLSGDKARAYLLIDNALGGAWDHDMLPLELEDLREYAGAIGFEADELEQLLQGWECDLTPTAVRAQPAEDPGAARLVLICDQADAEGLRAWLLDRLEDCPVPLAFG